jgi:hypothetical protein
MGKSEVLEAVLLRRLNFKWLAPQPGQAGTKKDLACPGNSKFQIPNEEVSCGHILNAFGEEHTAAFLILKSWRKIFGL